MLANKQPRLLNYQGETYQISHSVDARQCVPPEPLILIFEAFEIIMPNQVIEVWAPHVPVPLFEQLDRRQTPYIWSWLIDETQPSENEVDNSKGELKENPAGHYDNTVHLNKNSTENQQNLEFTPDSWLPRCLKGFNHAQQKPEEPGDWVVGVYIFKIDKSDLLSVES